MSLRRAVGVLTAAGMLALLVWVSVWAQSPRPQAPQNQPAPARTYVPTPPTRQAPTISFPGPGAYPVQPANASNPYASSAGGAFPSHADAPPGLVLGQLVPVKLQLASGLLLEGNIDASGPFPCAATFGEVSIPLTAIRGIRLHEGTSNASNPLPAANSLPAASVLPAANSLPAASVLPAATVILNNNDSLTVSLRATQMQIKTAWGTAIIDLPHVQSLLLTTDAVEWRQAGDRWILTPVERPSPAEEATEAEAPANPGTTAPGLDVPPTFGSANTES